MKTSSCIPKIVIIGGGFAGVQVAKQLVRQHAQAVITLVSDREYLTYYPSLYSLVTDGTQSSVALPLDTLLHESVHFMKGAFTSVDQSKQIVTIMQGERETTLPYDYLVMALGSQANYFNIPGLEERSLSFKSVDAALILKSHFETTFAKSKNLDKESLAARLHVLIVGGGPSGIELASTLKNYLKCRAKAHGIDPSFVTIDLIEAGPRLLPTMSEKVSMIAEKRLRTLGINIFTNRSLQAENGTEVDLGDMEVKTNTVIWTAGTSINSLYPGIEGVTLTERKRVTVTEYLALPNDNHVFIAGDGAATRYSGLAQTAIHNGNYIGKTIARMIKQKPLIPYQPHEPVFVIPVGKQWGIFSYKNIVLKGYFIGILRTIIDWRYRFSTKK